MEKENNSVLPKRKIARKMNWSENEIICLIHLWQENYENLTKMKRNRLVYDVISAGLHENGYQRTSEEIQKKISNLFAKYK